VGPSCHVRGSLDPGRCIHALVAFKLLFRGPGSSSSFQPPAPIASAPRSPSNASFCAAVNYFQFQQSRSLPLHKVQVLWPWKNGGFPRLSLPPSQAPSVVV
jgi:hypothetical protein